MTAASFYTLTYWLAFGAISVYLLWLVCAEVERRKQARRRRERLARRRYLDSLEPKRWTP